MIETIDKINF